MNFFFFCFSGDIRNHAFVLMVLKSNMCHSLGTVTDTCKFSYRYTVGNLCWSLNQQTILSMYLYIVKIF